MNDSGRPEILFLAHRFPYPPDKGDRIRTFHILQWLSRQARIHLGCLADEPFEMEALKRLETHLRTGRGLSLGKYSSRVRIGGLPGARQDGECGGVPVGRAGEDRERLGSADTVQGGNGLVFGTGTILAHPRAEETRTVFDLVDVDSQKWLDYAREYPRPETLAVLDRGEATPRAGVRTFRMEKAIVLVSEAETKLYRNFTGAEHVYTVTNGVDLEAFQIQGTPARKESGCVFVGALDYFPNVDAACWFCRDVWPEIHRVIPRRRWPWWDADPSRRCVAWRRSRESSWSDRSRTFVPSWRPQPWWWCRCDWHEGSRTRSWRHWPWGKRPLHRLNPWSDSKQTVRHLF